MEPTWVDVWGLVANWFAAVGTVGALFLGFALFIRESNQKQRAQADAFVVNSATTGRYLEDGETMRWTLTLFAHNTSAQPILSAIVRSEPGAKHFLVHSINFDQENNMAIAPDEQVKSEIQYDYDPHSDELVVYIRDASGGVWVRDLWSFRYLPDRKLKAWEKGWARDRRNLSVTTKAEVGE